MADGVPEEVLHLIIRFSASIADLPLQVPYPQTTSTLSLKHLIREHLPEEFASNRLRLIHAGKALQDAAALSKSLKWVPPPPQDRELVNNGLASGKGKGKAAVRDGDVGAASPAPPWIQRMYIHCSIGDALTPQELESEFTLADNLDASLASEKNTKSSHYISQEANSQRRGSANAGTASTSAQPQGFDRLLNAGFTAAEVAELRSQFMQNLAFTHTPDMMPTGAALRAMEDRWFDNGAQDDPASAAGEGEAGAGGWGFSFRTEDGALDDILWGNLIGFFWPIGALVWGLREEGVWTTRRKMVILSGIAMNVLFGIVKWSS